MRIGVTRDLVHLVVAQNILTDRIKLLPKDSKDLANLTNALDRILARKYAIKQYDKMLRYRAEKRAEANAAIASGPVGPTGAPVAPSEAPISSTDDPAPVRE